MEAGTLKPHIQGVPFFEVTPYEPLIRKMYEGIRKKSFVIGLFSPESIMEALKNRDMQLWIGVEEMEIKCCFITEIVAYPKARVLVVQFAYGIGRKFIKPAVWLCRRYAKAHGCRYMNFGGRRGWKRHLSDMPVLEAFQYYQEV